MLRYFYWFSRFHNFVWKYFGYIKLEMYVYSKTNLYSTLWFKIIWCKIYFILRFTCREWLNIYISSLIYFLIILFYFKYFFIQFSFKQWSLRLYLVEHCSFILFLIEEIFYLFCFILFQFFFKYYKLFSFFWKIH